MSASFGINAPAAGGLPTLSGSQWGTQDAAGYWSGWGSPYSPEEAAHIAAQSAADRQAMADAEAATARLAAAQPAQEINRSGAFGSGPGGVPAPIPAPSMTNPNQNNIRRLGLMALLMGGAGGQSAAPQQAPLVAAAQFSRRGRDPNAGARRNYASGGVTEAIPADILEQFAKAFAENPSGGVNAPAVVRDGYIYTPMWTTSSSGGGEGGDLTHSLSGLNRLKQGWQYGDKMDAYDTAGKFTGQLDTTAPNWADKFMPMLIKAAVMAGFGSGVSNLIGGAGPVGDASGFIGEGTHGAGVWTDAGQLVGGEGVSGLSAMDLASQEALNAVPQSAIDQTTQSLLSEIPVETGGLETLSPNYVNPKALLDGTNSFGANSAPGALDISTLDAATTATGAQQAVSEIARNSGYTATQEAANIARAGAPPVSPGTPNAPVKPKLTDPSTWLDAIMADPLKYLSAAALISGAVQNGGGGGGGGGYASYQGGIPSLTASRGRIARDPNRRPGSAPQRAFTDVQYRAAGGPIHGGIQGLLQGPGDGVSDSIPARIGGVQEAALSGGEYVIPARAVSELGNGSTEAGAAQLDAMVKRIQNTRRRNADVAADTKARQHMPV